MLRRFLVAPESIDGDVATLDEAQSRHAVQVLRLTVGEEVVVSDGEVEITGRIATAHKDKVEIALTGKAIKRTSEKLKLILAPAVIRSNRMDLVIEKATELGVAEIAPFVCERSVAKPDRSKVERWRKIARSAAQQSGRSDAPEIVAPVNFDDAIRRAADIKIIFSETERSRFFEGAVVEWDKIKSRSQIEVIVLIGPEGGFTDEERVAAIKAGWISAGLGSTILRAETASIAALAMLRYAFR